jgi:glutamyl-tRNA synthetase
MTVRTRFAPSPTGQVHIGNMRAALYNWLYARHHGGQFLLRLEDTDRERSTEAAVRTVFEAMEWLGLNVDEPPLHQSSQLAVHRAAAERLLAQGDAYRSSKGGEGGEAVVFRIPWDAGKVPGVSVAGPCEMAVHPDEPILVDRSGVRFAQVSSKGKPVPDHKCLAGFPGLEAVGADGAVLFRLADALDGVLSGERREEFRGAVKLRFTRRTIAYRDLVKGELTKPLDSMADFVIVRSDGNPVFHLGNVVDDITQRISHIIRGDDHVENTYRHLFLFHALGATPPQYAHLPMIVNKQGKPYSKRDGDAYVGEFRDMGLLPEALFNYLALLGWSPGDGQEVFTREDLVARFDFDRVQSSPAQMDPVKLLWVNGEHMRRQPLDERMEKHLADLRAHGLWTDGGDRDYVVRVLSIMADRIKLYSDTAKQTIFFFTDDYPQDPKVPPAVLQKPGAKEGLAALREKFAALPAFDAAPLQAALTDLATARGEKPGALVHPVRAAVSGTNVGPGLYEMLEVLGRDRVLARIDRALKMES